MPKSLQLLCISIPDGVLTEELNDTEDFLGLTTFTRATGDLWLSERRTAVLKVPCAVVPKAFNFLINPAHPEARSISIQNYESFDVDPRLKR
jgi:RES domain-containing protein